MTMTNPALALLLAFSVALAPLGASPQDDPELVLAAPLARAGENRVELEAALRSLSTPEEHTAITFLLEHMPEPDLRSLGAEFLVENVRGALEARRQAPWGEQIPEAIFLGYVLPYANVTERRDRWRADFAERFRPWVAAARTPAEAAALLNQRLFPELGVRYSTQRRRADQGPYESLESGLASCTGLSILLIDACRAVGVPARFVGTPRWTDDSGNHSWVEVWSEGAWHFTGAAEPTGTALDQGWFVERASRARAEDPRYAIYAVSYARTPLRFPLVWSRGAHEVWATNVTARYVDRVAAPAAGETRVRFRVHRGGKRLEATVRLHDREGKLQFTGVTKDERYDANDHLSTVLPTGATFRMTVAAGQASAAIELLVADGEQIVSLELPADSQEAAPPQPEPLALLAAHLEKPEAERPPLAAQPFASVPLTAEQARAAAELLVADHHARVRVSRAAEMEARRLRHGELEMPFFYEVFGEKPAQGRSLYLSMHGGGGAPQRVNDQQWENQKKLYRIEEGVYLAPRAPTDTWNLWHQEHIDDFFDRLIENLIVFEDVDPERVYLTGYSAGGDGVYQLAPRMADRFAAAAMMAGHPNETSPLGLYNLPFTLQMGGKDEAYGRNRIAGEWKTKLEELASQNPGGYLHWVEIHPEHGHWMQRDDAAALPWMAKFRRKTFPERIVWKQDDVRHDRFYWLATDASAAPERALVIARREGQTIHIESSDVDEVRIRLSDSMLDLDREVLVLAAGKEGAQELFRARAPRTIAVLAQTLAERGDPSALFSAEVTVRIAR